MTRADAVDAALAGSVAILFVLRGAGRDIYRRLMDAVDPDLVEVAERSLAATPGVVDVKYVRLRWVGAGSTPRRAPTWLPTRTCWMLMASPSRRTTDSSMTFPA